MILSEQQKAVLHWVEHEDGSLNLIARAGCGKTTTLLEAVLHIVKNGLGEVFVGAYNKAIADELQSRLRKAGVNWRDAMASTLHSAGFSAWRKVAPDVKVDGDKVKKILENKMTEDDYKKYYAFVRAAVSLAKQRAFGVLCDWQDKGQWMRLVEHFGLDEHLPEEKPTRGEKKKTASDEGDDAPTDKWNAINHLERAIDISMKAFRASVARDREVIDFDDMIFAPLMHNARMWPKDFVMIDEAQDTNPARRALAMKMLRPGTGQLIAVGDPAQASCASKGRNLLAGP